MAADNSKPDEKPATISDMKDNATVTRVPSVHNGVEAHTKKKRIWIWGAIGLVSIAAAALAHSQFWMTRIQTVVVEISELSPATRVLAVNGQIAAVHSLTVRPLVSGTLERLSVIEGDKVAVGQVLGKINADNQNAIVRQSMAGLDASLETQRQATEDYARTLKLGNAVARTALENDGHAKQSATQEVARQTALLDQSTIALKNHTIHAPIAGSVLILNVDLGQLVDPSTALLTLANLQKLVVETDVDEVYATQIAEDQPARLQLAGESGIRAGHVSYVSAQVDIATGGLAVRIAFEEQLEAPIGMSVTTNIIVEQRAEALTLPRTAIVASETGSAFYVVVNGKAHLRPVSVIEWPAARLIVTAGLSEGDTVVVDAEGLKDGQSVDGVLP